MALPDVGTFYFALFEGEDLWDHRSCCAADPLMPCADGCWTKIRKPKQIIQIPAVSALDRALALCATQFGIVEQPPCHCCQRGPVTWDVVVGDTYQDRQSGHETNLVLQASDAHSGGGDALDHDAAPMRPLREACRLRSCSPSAMAVPRCTASHLAVT